MKRLLEKMNDAVNQVGGRLPHKEAEQWKVQ
jgi:transposase